MGKTNRKFNESGAKGNRAIRDKQRQKMKQSNKINPNEVDLTDESIDTKMVEKWAESFDYDEFNDF